MRIDLKKHVLPWVLGAVALSITLWLFLHDPAKTISVKPLRGTVDVAGLDPRQAISLEGEWGFHEGLTLAQTGGAGAAAFVAVPHVFGKNPRYGGNPYGAASYTLLVRGLDTGLLYAVSAISEASASRLTVNGAEVMKNGVVSAVREEHKPEMRFKTGFFRADTGGEARFAIEISNFSYNNGGFWNPLVIGEAQAMLQRSKRAESIEVYLFAVFLTMGLFCLGLFTTNPQFKALLHFSFICFLMGFRTLLTNHKQFYDIIFNIPWDLATRLEFLTGYLLLPAFGMFFFHLEFVKRKDAIRWVFHGLSVAAVALMAFAPNEIYANLLPWYRDICVLSMPYFGFLTIRGLMKRRFDALLILVSLLGFVPTILYDFYGSGELSLMPYGMYVLLLTFSIVVIRNLFELRKKHDHLEVAITLDPLTGLNNRHYLDQVASAGLAVTEGRRLFIFFFDLDRFKHFNDTLGHDAGDRILRNAAERLKACFRASDIVCRYGGDEFVAIAEMRQGEGDVRTLVDRVLKRFAEPMQAGGESITIGVSIGVSEFRAGMDLAKAIAESDEAMYRAKKRQSEKIVMYEPGEGAALPK